MFISDSYTRVWTTYGVVLGDIDPPILNDFDNTIHCSIEAIEYIERQMT